MLNADVKNHVSDRLFRTVYATYVIGHSNFFSKLLCNLLLFNCSTLHNGVTKNRFDEGLMQQKKA